MRTRVGIVGAGPAGLMLSHLLHLAGIDSIVIESRSRAYCEARVRAGLIEHWAAQMLIDTGLGERLKREGLVHGGINIAFGGAMHNLDFKALVGKVVTVYGQQEVVKDMIARRLADGGQILFEVENTVVRGFEGDNPSIAFRHEGRDQTIECDFIGGCDGFHGVCRPAMGADIRVFEREYPFGWLGILGEAKPVDEELIYTYHDRGFALFSMRSPSIVRYYLQCAHDDDAARWTSEQIWDELELRLTQAGGPAPQRGRILEKGVTAMRSFVAEPMRKGRLFLAGDSAHIVPPTGAKGMNLALADVRVLARAIEAYYKSGKSEPLENYSDTALRRIWKAQRFSWWMTQMLHRFNFEDDFDKRRQIGELDYVTSSEAAARSLAENYVGLPMD